MYKETLVWICKKSFTILFVWLFLVVITSVFPHRERENKQGPPKPIKDVKLEMIPEGLKVKWEKVSGATHYTIFWGNESGTYTKLHDVPTNEVTFTVSKEDYIVFAITAWNKKGESEYSPEISVDLKEKRLVKKE